jgi:Fur family peroxide stress response transcriptional regulator
VEKHHPVSSRNALESLEAYCRSHGLPLTVQRRVILAALVGRDDHPTADQILTEVRPQLPGVSRTTVYRVLDTFVRIGLAVKTCHPGTAVRFDPRTERHHHLVCTRCEKVIDLHDVALDRLAIPSTSQLGFEITNFSVHFRGLCAACRKGGSPDRQIEPLQARTTRREASVQRSVRRKESR